MRAASPCPACYWGIVSRSVRGLCRASDCASVHVQAIGCLILFTFVGVLATLLTKLMASHSHKAAYFRRMQAAIRKAGRLGESMRH